MSCHQFHAQSSETRWAEGRDLKSDGYRYSAAISEGVECCATTTLLEYASGGESGVLAVLGVCFPRLLCQCCACRVCLGKCVLRVSKMLWRKKKKRKRAEGMVGHDATSRTLLSRSGRQPLCCRVACLRLSPSFHLFLMCQCCAVGHQNLRFLRRARARALTHTYTHTHTHGGDLYSVLSFKVGIEVSGFIVCVCVCVRVCVRIIRMYVCMNEYIYVYIY
jgi:hypothetical protein